MRGDHNAADNLSQMMVQASSPSLQSLLDDMLAPKDWLYHQRYSPAYMRKTWVGYPVQSNLWRLPEAEVMGIVQVAPNPNP